MRQRDQFIIGMSLAGLIFFVACPSQGWARQLPPGCPEPQLVPPAVQSSTREMAAVQSFEAPTISISPNGGTYSNGSVSVFINWSDCYGLVPESRVISLNGQNITHLFSHSWGTYSQQSTATISLPSTNNTLTAYICNIYYNCSSATANYTYPDVEPPVASIVPGSSVIASGSVAVTITWTDNRGLDAASRQITLNGNSVVGNFSYSGSATWAQSQGTLSLAPGTNTLTARIRDSAGNWSNTWQVTYTVPTYGVSVTPDGTPITVRPNSSHSYTFTVTNTGNQPATFNLSKSCSGTASQCSLSSSSITLGGGASGTVTVNFVSGKAGGTGTVNVTATQSDRTNITDSGSIAVTSAYPTGPGPAPVVRITPASKVVLPSESPLSVRIEICSSYPSTLDSGSVVIKRDGVDVTAQFSHQPTVLPDCDGPDDFGMVSTGTVDVQRGATLTVDAWSFTGWLGTGVAYYTAPPPQRGVTVTADGQYMNVNANREVHARFTIRNTGEVPDTFAISHTCSGSAIAGNCVLSAPIVVLDTGEARVVDVTFTTGSTIGSTGLVNLQASRTAGSPPVSAASWTEVTVVPAPGVGVALVSTGDVLARDQCLTISLGSGAASECGDLRLVHQLPAVRTLGGVRAPTLLYNSQHARPSPIVHADVTVPSGGPLPTRVEAVVTIAGAQRGYAEWAGTHWGTAGATRRIAVMLDTAFATGVYDYALQVTFVASNGARTSYVANGKLPVVNRSASNFGSGWWVAGLEELHVLDSNRVFWVGGDGSARLYTRDAVNPSVYRASRVVRPDSITKDAAGNYIRWAPDRVKVHFNGSGRHDSTTNRLGYVTRFKYDGPSSRRLWKIEIPTVSAGPLVYTLSYNPGGVLNRVEAPGPINGGAPREVLVMTTSARVDSIRDADSTWVRFGYGSGTDAKLVVSSKDRRGITTSFLYDAGKRVIRRSLTLEGGSVVRDSLAPAETRGLPGAPNGTAQPLDSVFTLLDGPRTDVQDLTKFWTNAYGAPTRIRNALGQETRVWYDATWPGLAARVQEPNRLVRQAWYNGRGLPDSISVMNPLGDGRNARTRYAWHSTLDLPTQVISPEGTVTTYGYDAATGNRIWQQVGNDTLRRVYFDYDATTKLLTRVRAPLSDPDSIFYDALGNVHRTRSPMGFTTLVYRDAIGRDTMVYTPVDTAGKTITNVLQNGAWERTTYDLADRPRVVTSWGPGVTIGLRTVPGDSVRVSYNYDSEGNLTNVVRSYSKAGQNFSLQTHWIYDNAGRVKAHAPSGSGFESYILDPAGNVTKVYTRRGHVIEFQYDALGRMTRRVVPQVNYPQLGCLNYVQCLQFSFPTLDARPGVCIPADTARFEYDEAGRMTRADNMYARVRRTYTPNGLLSSEELRIRTYYRSGTLNPCGEEAPEPMSPVPSLDWDFNQHVYLTAYTYDLDGRRRTLDDRWNNG